MSLLREYLLEEMKRIASSEERWGPSPLKGALKYWKIDQVLDKIYSPLENNTEHSDIVIKAPLEDEVKNIGTEKDISLNMIKHLTDIVNCSTYTCAMKRGMVDLKLFYDNRRIDFYYDDMGLHSSEPENKCTLWVTENEYEYLPLTEIKARTLAECIIHFKDFYERDDERVAYQWR